MKSSLFFAAVISVASLALSGARAASTSPDSPPAISGDSVKKLAGEYAGKWQGHGDLSGNLRLKLKQEGDAWTAEASFTVEDASITPKVKAIKVDGGKLELTFDWEYRGNAQETVLTGEVSADTLSGRYESKTSGESSNGTWSVKRA